MSESYGACEAGLGTTGNAFYNAIVGTGRRAGHHRRWYPPATTAPQACDDPNSSDFAIQWLGSQRNGLHAIQRGRGRHRLPLHHGQPILGLLECTDSARHHGIRQVLYSRNHLERYLRRRGS